jgi:arylsulfatase A-like enzyme
MPSLGIRCVVAIAMCVAVCCAHEVFAAPAPPNVVLILTDDQGYADLGCYGAKQIKTPRVDQMAAEGIRFTDFYAAANVCTPSRAALLTGCYPQRVGMGEIPPVPEGKPWQTRVLYPQARFGLNPDEITIAELLKARGYVTGIVGKWHLGDRKPFMPLDHGFDSFFGCLYTNDTPGVTFARGYEIIPGEIDQTTFTDRFTDESIQFIRQNRDKPFFLFLSHIMPHVPIHAAERHRGKSAGGLYGDVIEALDESTGKVLDLLKELKIDENTLVIFTSDNGPWLAKGENGGSATPLRGGKGGCYEGGMRVPCIMRWPGVIPAGKVCSELTVNFDLYPTIAQVAGAAIPTDRIIDGKDLGDLMRGKPGAKAPHEYFIYYNGNRMHGVRSGPWKLKIPTTLAEEFGDYAKLDNPQTIIPRALYNLDLDPGEQKNVLKDHPDVVENLQPMIESAREDLGDSRRNLVGKNVRPIGESSP